MRRYKAALAGAGLMATALASATLAAAPAPNRHFSGNGSSHIVQNGHWARNGSGHFTFRTSGRIRQSNGKVVYVEQFHGTYLECHGTRTFIGGTNLAVNKQGKFQLRFHHHGAWVRIWGTFGGNGTSAEVSYVVNFSGSNTDPNTIHSGCASWVHGTATT
jgi:hypothetical protein